MNVAAGAECRTPPPLPLSRFVYSSSPSSPAGRLCFTPTPTPPPLSPTRGSDRFAYLRHGSWGPCDPCVSGGDSDVRRRTPGGGGTPPVRRVVTPAVPSGLGKLEVVHCSAGSRYVCAAPTSPRSDVGVQCELPAERGAGSPVAPRLVEPHRPVPPSGVPTTATFTTPTPSNSPSAGSTEDSTASAAGRAPGGVFQFKKLASPKEVSRQGLLGLRLEPSSLRLAAVLPGTPAAAAADPQTAAGLLGCSLSLPHHPWPLTSQKQLDTIWEAVPFNDVLTVAFHPSPIPSSSTSSTAAALRP